DGTVDGTAEVSVGRRLDDPESDAHAQARRSIREHAQTTVESEVPAPQPEAEKVLSTEPGTHFDVKTQVDLGDANNMSSGAGTLSFWMRPDWEKGNLDDATLVELGDSGVFVTKAGDSLRFEVTDQNGEEQTLSFPISAWEKGHWRYISATWDNG